MADHSSDTQAYKQEDDMKAGCLAFLGIMMVTGICLIGLFA